MLRRAIFGWDTWRFAAMLGEFFLSIKPSYSSRYVQEHSLPYTNS